MNLVQFKWKLWTLDDGQPPYGAISLNYQGVIGPPTWNVLQYRERENIHEIGLQEPIWSEWHNT